MLNSLADSTFQRRNRISAKEPHFSEGTAFSAKEPHFSEGTAFQRSPISALDNISLVVVTQIEGLIREVDVMRRDLVA